MLQKIGYVKQIKWEEMQSYLHSFSYEERRKILWEEKLYALQGIELEKSGVKIKMHSTIKYLIPNNNWKYNSKGEREYDNGYEEESEIKTKVEKGISHYIELNIPINVVYEDNTFITFFYNNNDAVTLLKQFVVMEKAKDYSELTCKDMKRLITSEKTKGNSENPLETLAENKTTKIINKELEDAKNNLEIAQKQAQKELEEFRQQMYLKEQELRAMQQAKLDELNEIKNKLEDQIFLLELNIFALRSIFGETYSMTQIIKGKNAPKEQPLQLYQKFRYLDEEFARFEEINAIDTKPYRTTEIFSKNPELVNTFCPSAKCITFFKTSKDNVTYSYCREEDCLAMYKYYHGNQIGMLIRNGENLYLSFIDEEVTLHDNLFVTEYSAQQETTIKIGKTKLRDKEARPMLNRRLIFIILQQIINNTNIFDNLKEENIFNSNLIVLTDADKQIVTHKYPSFRECFDKYKDIKLGDYVFILEKHRGSKVTDIYSRYEEHRGIGYKNTARDADIESGVTKISIIENIGATYYKRDEQYWCQITKSEYEKLKDSGEVLKKKDNYHYFVSCKRTIEDWQRPKDYWGNITTTRVNNANLRVYEDEFMSVMWLNSNYPRYWVDSKHIGNWRDANYTYLIPKLKILKDFLVERERVEWENLKNYITEKTYTDKLKDIVLNWRIQHTVRTLTNFQAKRFAKYYKEQG